jgi:hypothetical protein
MMPRPPKVGEKVCYRGEGNIYLVTGYDALVRLCTTLLSVGTGNVNMLINTALISTMPVYA